MIEVTINKNNEEKEFPIILKINDRNQQKLTFKAAIELRNRLNDELFEISASNTWNEHECTLKDDIRYECHVYDAGVCRDTITCIKQNKQLI